MSRKVLLLTILLYVVRHVYSSYQTQKLSEIHQKITPKNWLFHKRFVREDKEYDGGSETQDGIETSSYQNFEYEDYNRLEDEEEEEEEEPAEEDVPVDDGVCPVNVFIVVVFVAMIVGSCCVVMVKCVYIYCCETECDDSELTDDRSKSVNISFLTSTSQVAPRKMSKKEVKTRKLGELPPPLVFDKPGKIPRNAKKFIEGCMRDSAKRTFSQPFSRHHKVSRLNEDVKKSQKCKEIEDGKVEDQVKKLLIQAMLDTSNDYQKRCLCFSILQMIERSGQGDNKVANPGSEVVDDKTKHLDVTTATETNAQKAMDLLHDKKKRDEAARKISVDQLIKLFIETVRPSQAALTTKGLEQETQVEGKDQNHLIQGILNIFAANLKEDSNQEEKKAERKQNPKRDEEQLQKAVKDFLAKMEARGNKPNSSQRLIPPRGYYSAEIPNSYSTELIASLKEWLDNSLKGETESLNRSLEKPKPEPKTPREKKR